MKKFFTLFLALVATMSLSTLSAETLSFETDEEISHWHFINGSQPNYWTIGTAAGATDGSKALYITNNGSSYNYDNSQSSFVWAYYDVLMLGSQISFDWKCVGEGGCDYLSVYLVPSVSEISAGSSSVPNGSICLSKQLNQHDFWTSLVYEGSSTEYYLCFLWRNDGSAGSQPIAIDKIEFSPVVNDGLFAYAHVGETAYSVLRYIGSSPEVVIPTIFNNKPIVSISAGCFQNNTSLTSVTIPNSVTSIGSYAFNGCSNLSSFAWTVDKHNTDSINSNNSINSNSVYFVNTNRWQDVYVYAWGGTIDGAMWPGVKANKANWTYAGYDVYYFEANIGDYSMCIFSDHGSSQTDDLVWNGGMLYYNGEWIMNNMNDMNNNSAVIGNMAFFNCSSLTSITIPNGVSSIGREAFANCSSLTSIYVNGSYFTPANIDTTVFYNTNNAPIYVPYDFLYKCSWSYYADRIFQSPYYNPYTEVSITANPSKSALHQALGLDSLQKVVSLKINGTINSYDIMMLRNQMPDLRELDLSDASIVANAYEYTDGYCSKDNTLTTQAFTGTGTRIFKAILPRTLKRVETNTFNSYLFDLTISGGAIANNAFYSCSNIKTLTLEEGVSSIGTSVFENCTGIKSVTIPSSIANIGGSAFKGCSNLSNVSFAGDVQTIGSSAFYGCSNLSEVSFAGDVKNISQSAFEDCSALDSIALPESLETIGASAFRGAGLKEITIPANVRAIGTYAFAGRSGGGDYDYYNSSTSNSTSYWWHGSNSGSLQTVTIPANSRLTTIPEGAFVRNYNLKKVSILCDSITSIRQGAFAGCGMDTIVLPPNLTSLSRLAFGYCTNLKYIAMPNSLTSIVDNAFVGCSSLDNVQFPTKLESIGHHAFADCTTLRNVDIPGLVTEIGDYAFKDCNVRSVYSYLFDPFTIGQNTFSPYANANATLYIPNVEDTEMKYLYDTQWSQFLNRVRMDKDFEYNDFYAKGDVIIGDNDDPLNGDPNANLEPGSGLIVEEGENGQSLGTITITGEPGDWASIIAGCNLHVDSLRLIIKVQGKCWNFYGFPFNIPIADIKSEGKYVIYEYDGKTRAEKDTTGWKRLPKEQTHLYPGHGYIFNFSVSGELSITIPAPNFCNLLEKIMLHFYPAVKDNNKSWNYAANPFFAYYSLNDLNFTGPITFWDATNKTYRSYRPGDDDYYLSPYEGFFLQNETEADFELTFDKTKTKTKKQKEEAQASGAHKPARKAAADTQREIINLTLLSDDYSDDTRVVINPAAQLTYDLGMDAQKFFSTDNVPQLYSLDADQLPCAINERPIDNGIINLGMKLPAAGLYTLRATRMDKNLFLLDREMNVLHSFADGDYTFSASAGTVSTRFALVEHYDAPTAVENIADSQIEQTPNGLYIHGSADIQIYSMTGVELYNGTYSGAITLPTGVYTLVCNGKPAKVVIQ